MKDLCHQRQERRRNMDILIFFALKLTLKPVGYVETILLIGKLVRKVYYFSFYLLIVVNYKIYFKKQK